MGNHAVSGKDAKSPKGLCLPAARAVAATGVLAISVCGLNLSGSTPEPGTAAASVVRPGAGMGAAETPTGSSSRTSTGTATDIHGPADAGEEPSDGLVAGALTASILTAPEVEIAFPRPLVTGSGEDARSPLTVELTGLGRPPAGYLMAPLKLLNPSSPFGFRVSPLSGAAGDFHLGQDYAAPCGTQVYAADSGVVRAAGWHPWGGGNRVEIDHGNGLISTYNHLDSIAVRSGDSVSVGQAIARVGSTGWSTGCHLHFETILNGHHISPLKWRLIPLRPVGTGMGDLRTYLPWTDAPSTGPIHWTIPVGQGSEPPSAPRWVNKPSTAAGSPSGTASWLSTLKPADSGTPSWTAPAVPSTTSPTGSPSPTPSPTDPETGTPTPTPTDPETGTPTPTPTDPETGTPTPTPTDPETGTPTPSPTDPETGTPTPTPTDPETGTPTPSPTDPETGTPTPTDPETGTPTPTDPETGTPTPVEPPPAPVEPAPAPVEPAPVEPPPAPVEPAPAPVVPAPAPVEPAPVEPAPAPIVPSPVEPAPAPTATFTAQPTPAPIETTEPVPLPTSPSATPSP